MPKNRISWDLVKNIEKIKSCFLPTEISARIFGSYTQLLLPPKTYFSCRPWWERVGSLTWSSVDVTWHIFGGRSKKCIFSRSVKKSVVFFRCQGCVSFFRNVKETSNVESKRMLFSPSPLQNNGCIRAGQAMVDESAQINDCDWGNGRKSKILIRVSKGGLCLQTYWRFPHHRQTFVSLVNAFLCAF